MDLESLSLSLRHRVPMSLIGSTRTDGTQIALSLHLWVQGNFIPCACEVLRLPFWPLSCVCIKGLPQSLTYTHARWHPGLSDCTFTDHKNKAWFGIFGWRWWGRGLMVTLVSLLRSMKPNQVLKHRSTSMYSYKKNDVIFYSLSCHFCVKYKRRYFLIFYYVHTWK